MKAVDAASVLSVVIDTAASSIIAPSSKGARRSNRPATYAMSAIPEFADDSQGASRLCGVRPHA